MLNAAYVWGDLPAPESRQTRPVLSATREVVLRIEDHDRERCRPEYEAGILEDLAWLGYQPHFPLVRQSERHAIYGRAAQRLIERGLVYACNCTRREIEQQAREPRDAEAGAVQAELVYSGRCRDRRLPIADGVGWRVRMDPGVEAFDDQLLGPQAQDPSQQCGDVLIRDRLGNWTYQFAASVDDFEQGIDLVIRGVDLLASTGRQIRIARWLGRERPAVFLHHPLLMKTPSQKLSKSDGATGVRDLRAQGWTPADVRAAALPGLLGPGL